MGTHWDRPGRQHPEKLKSAIEEVVALAVSSDAETCLGIVRDDDGNALSAIIYVDGPNTGAVVDAVNELTDELVEEE